MYEKKGRREVSSAIFKVQTRIIVGQPSLRCMQSINTSKACFEVFIMFLRKE